MYVLTLIFSVLFLNAMVTELKKSVAYAAEKRPRIYAQGGRLVEPQEFPFLVLVDLSEGSCSGSIPSPTTMLTTAARDMDAAIAYAGIINWEELASEFAQKRRICKCIQYSRLKMHDIQICYVDSPWAWTPYVRPVKLYLEDVVLPSSFAKLCQVVGFGQGSEGSEPAVARVMDQLMSSALHCATGIGAPRYFHTYGMCSVNVRNKTICHGDEGGPVLCSEECETTQWGIVGSMIPSNSLCRLPVDLNSYVFTAYYRNWIKENIQDLSSGGSDLTDTQRRPTTIKVCILLMTYGFSLL